MKIFIFCSLFLGFFLLSQQTQVFRQLEELVKKTRSDMDEAARQRTLEERKRLLSLQEHSFLWRLELKLRYSGLHERFPGLTAEWWIAGNLVVCAALFCAAAAFFGLGAGIAACALFVAAETEGFRMLRTRNLQKVNENLLKLLDVLGNYSITAGELTGVFHQVSRYMEEPIRSALENCCLEAETTGDIDMALLSMAECVEHPKFQELARNMEISVRYCADFSAMVNSSRRSMREYLRVLQERKGMLREALINMVLLLGMSFVVLAVVGNLIGTSIRDILFQSLPGRIALGVILLILGLFAGQMRKIQS